MGASYFDVAQITLYLFWIFFAGLVVYLLRENKREGYPLESDGKGRGTLQGFPAMPAAKTYLLPHGGTQTAPRKEKDDRALAARPVARFPGAPLTPVGDAMLAGVGPGAWAQRADTPDLTIGGHSRIVPLRVAGDFHLEPRDPDPRGMQVLGSDNVAGGKVKDVWIDRSESLVRYLEVEISGPAADGLGNTILLPVNFSKIDMSRRVVRVRSVLGAQLRNVPKLTSPDQVSRREEDRITAYFGAGTLYATPARAEPLL